MNGGEGSPEVCVWVGGWVLLLLWDARLLAKQRSKHTCESL